VAIALAILIAGNRRSLVEGVRYLRQMANWQPDPARHVAPEGPFGMCYELVQLGNADRLQRIVQRLRGLGLNPTLIPIPGEPQSNVLVRFRATGPYTLFVAHYDKSRETPTYQGASDNTAAVCVLLAAAAELAAEPPARPVGLLFTAAEERGLKGAEAFVRWARAQALEIAEVINFDMLGRDRLAIRPSALPGFYFWVPGVGELVYDGRRLTRGEPYPPPDPELVRRLKTLLGDELVLYERFTARSDSNVFQAAGFPTVSVSSDNMYYLDLVWDRDADRIEWLDENNLALALRLITEYAARSNQRTLGHGQGTVSTAKEQTYLFVYGTLRRDVAHPMHAVLAAHAEFIGAGTFQGKLYDLGGYPGAVPSERETDIVAGEVYALRDPAQVLAVLDRYEGCADDPPPTEFRREKATITLENGDQVEAWIYLYNWPTFGLPRIRSGDYVQYVQGKGGPTTASET